MNLNDWSDMLLLRFIWHPHPWICTHIMFPEVKVLTMIFWLFHISFSFFFLQFSVLWNGINWLRRMKFEFDWKYYFVCLFVFSTKLALVISSSDCSFKPRFERKDTEIRTILPLIGKMSIKNTETNRNCRNHRFSTIKNSNHLINK